MYSEIFPTFIRSTGIGMAVAVGRAGGFAAPILTAYIYENTGNGENILGALLCIAAFFLATVLAAIPWALWGSEGMGKSLEDLGGDEIAEHTTEKLKV